MSDENNKKPKKQAKKRATKKRASKKKTVIKDDQLDPSLPPQSVMQFDAAALSAILKQYDNPKAKKAKQDIRYISEQIQEYLSCYILVGYTLNGKNVAVTYAPSPKDMDSLSTGLQRYILDGHFRGDMPGSEPY